MRWPEEDWHSDELPWWGWGEEGCVCVGGGGGGQTATVGRVSSKQWTHFRVETLTLILVSIIQAPDDLCQQAVFLSYAFSVPQILQNNNLPGLT